jgi:tetratricopeptide (TPR) repeat protein
MIKVLASGTPLVTTSIGAEGLDLVDGSNALVADSAAKLAAAVVRVYNEEGFWQRLATNGNAHAEQEYSLQRMQERMENVLAALRAIRPRSMPGDFHWSVRDVEIFNPQILADKNPAAPESLALRLHAYAEYAERLLAQGQPAEACAQLRHVFAFVQSPLPRHHFFTNVLTLLERCYRQLGKAEQGVRCGREAILFLPEFNLKPAQAAGPAQKSQAMRSFPSLAGTGRSTGDNRVEALPPVPIQPNGPRPEL